MNATEYAEMAARIRRLDNNVLTPLLLDLLGHVAKGSGYDPDASQAPVEDVATQETVESPFIGQDTPVASSEPTEPESAL